MKVGANGRVSGLRFVASPNCDERPPRQAVTLLVVHSISLPPGEFGGDSVERLFTNRLDPDAHPYFRGLAGLRVSAHFFVRRGGEAIQFVPLHLRAWHAGVSAWRGRQRSNDYSVGVELEGTDDAPFSRAQYATLIPLVRALRDATPLRDIAGHSDIAPQRKTDPGAGFAWMELLRELARS